MNQILISSNYHANNFLRIFPKSFYSGSRCFSIFIDLKDLEVKHDAKEQEFNINLDKFLPGTKARLQYDQRQPTVLNLYCTRVPYQLRGRGIGAKLAETAFQHVIQNNLKMRVTCTYLKRYIKKHPKPEYMSKIII